MPKQFVINASPIILYARIGKLNLLNELSSGVLIPDKVIEEIQKGAFKDNTAQEALAWAKQYRLENITVQPSVELWNLGPGESQVISRCLQSNSWAVLDDKMARRCIQAHDLEMTGSLGIIIRAKLFGLVSSARPWLFKLREAGLRVDPHLLEKALDSIGEKKK